MKKVFLFLVGVFIATNVYAVDITVTLTQEQYDAMSVMTTTPEQWVQDVTTNKANKMINRLVKIYSDKQPDKMSEAEKLLEIKLLA